MFYACGWGDEDGKPTYGYHGEDGCIKKNMFDGTLCLLLKVVFQFKSIYFFYNILPLLDRDVLQKRKLQNKYYELSIKITHVVLYFMTLILLFYRVCCSEWWMEMWSWGQNGMWSCHRQQEAIHQTPRRDSSVYLCHKEWKGHPCPGGYYPRRRILSHNIFLWKRYKSIYKEYFCKHLLLFLHLKWLVFEELFPLTAP